MCPHSISLEHNTLIFNPQQYKIRDEVHVPFIDHQEISCLLDTGEPSESELRKVIARARDKHRLSLSEVAVLLNTKSPTLIEEIKQAAAALKEDIYSRRIVLFAPLYVGNSCANNCSYCGFKSSNRNILRSTLTDELLEANTKALLGVGHKRLVMAYGEHPSYNPSFIADSIRKVYACRLGRHFIRRVNVNAAPFDVAGFKEIHDAGIGTYQIFQETYHRPTYAEVHLSGKKKNYDWRLTAFDRAMEAGIDDWGLGILLGLYDWRYEVLGLVRHVNHLEAVFNIGPHTISFPRMQEASDITMDSRYAVSDADFAHLIAVLRLAVPYAGLILTAREPAAVRKEMLRLGVSQIDGGSNIEMGGYSSESEEQDLNNEQFALSDMRSLHDVIDELLQEGYLPSFCTSCYEKGRTGEHFMEFSVNGFIKRFCQPNALTTLARYIYEFASPDLRKRGEKWIEKELNTMSESSRSRMQDSIARIKEGIAGNAVEEEDML